MKIRNTLIALLASSFLLAGCSNGSTSASNSGSISSTVTASSTPSSTTSEDFEHLTTDPIATGSYGGALIEILAGRYLEAGSSYSCVFTTSSHLNKKLTYKSKYDEVASIEAGQTDGAFIINAHKQGDTIIYAYDVEGTLVLRELVQVRKAIALENIASHLFNVDKWVSTKILGTYNLTFVSSNPLTGSLVGYDEFENTSIVFDLVDGYKDTIYEFNFYHFDFVLDMNQYYSNRSYVDFYVAVTGDYILIYYSSGSDASLLEMFTPDTAQ